MKKITFKVNLLKDKPISSLIKDVNKISCRIFVDIENGFVVAENIDDTMVDDVIELIDNYYTILNIEIDNEFKETKNEQFVFDVSKKVETVQSSEEVETVKSKLLAKKISGGELALLDNIEFAINKLDPSKKPEDQIESFLTDIGMTTTEEMVTKSFIIACDIDKINYENIILRLSEQFPEVKKEIIKNTLKEALKNWLNNYPNLAKEFPKISFTALLKIYSKALE